MRKAPPVSLSERFLSITRNFALCFYLSGFFLFLTGWLWKWTDVIVFGIPSLFYSLWIVLSWNSFQEMSLQSVRRAVKTIPSLAFWIVIIFLVLNFLFCLLPPSEHIEADALLYNLTIPWQHYLRGGITPLDWSMNDKFSLYLPLAQLPFTVATFPWVIKVWVIFGLPCLLAVCWGWTRFLGFSKEEGAWTLAFISALVLLIKQYGAANFDIINSVYILLGFLYLARATKTKQNPELIWAVLFLGLASAVKTFLFFMVFVWCLAFLVWKIFFARERLERFDFLLVFLPFVFAVVFVTPLFSRNYLITGNPFFPLFSNVLGPFIENEMHHNVMRHAHLGYGYGRSLLDFFLMPLRMVWPLQLKFDYWTDPFLLLFLAGAIFSLRRRIGTEFSLVSLISLFLYTFLFLGSQQARYFYPFWIFVVFLGAGSVFKWLGQKLWRVVLISQALLGVVCFGFFHRDALSHLKYLPQGKYLERSSFSYVWNQTLHQNLNGKKIKQLCLRMRPEDSIIDLFYFTVPMKILGHTTSILPLDARFTENCDQFMIGMQWPHNLIDTPIGKGMVVDKERYLHETFSK